MQSKTNLAIFLSIVSGNQLNQQLENWLDKAELTDGPARAIIAPYVFEYVK